MHSKAAAAFDLLEAIHGGANDITVWMKDLIEPARLFLGGDAVGAMLVRRDENRHTVLNSASAGFSTNSRAGFEALFATAPVLLGDIYYSRLVGRHSDHVPSIPKELDDFTVRARDAEGMHDAISLSPRFDRVIFNVYAGIRKPIEWSAEHRKLVTRLTIHLETGFRLRARVLEPIGFLRPDGQVLHATGAVETLESREALVQHVRAVESSRLREARRSPNSVSTWCALVAGKWGVIERLDPDGLRYYAVVENPGPAQRLLSLSELEAKALELSGRGLTGKLVAYAMGVSEGRVSAVLASAATKLGCTSRTRAVVLASWALSNQHPITPDAALTPAEQEVLSLVRNGFSNAEIAESRKTSVRTVVNQVAAILRKGNAPTRRAMAARRF